MVIVQDPLFNCPNVSLKSSEILPRNWVKEEVIHIKNTLITILRGWNRSNAIDVYEEEERAND